MPVTADNFLWEATGHTASSTSVVVTHPDAGGTTAGSTVLVFLMSQGAAGYTQPAGWAKDSPATPLTHAYRLDDATAAQTSWTFTRSPTSGNTAWYMVELTGLDLVEPFEGTTTGNSGTSANGATRSTGTTSLNAGSSLIAFGVFGCTKAASGDVNSWSGYTNSFAERADFSPAGIAGQQIAVACKSIDGWGTFESTATFATSTAGAVTAANMYLYRAADASINAPLAFLTGFEFGTHAGMGNPAVNNPLALQVAPTGTFGTNYLIQAGSARNGGFGLRIVASASIAYVSLPSVAANTAASGFNVRAVSATGTVSVAHFQVTGGSSDDLVLFYDASTEKFGVDWRSGSGTQWQSGTTPVGSWAWVDIRGRMNGSTYHADWSIETGGGAQTSPADLTGRTACTSVFLELGSLTSQTATFDFDDVVFSRYYAAYPLGPHTVRLLVPETTGATVSGTAASFNQFTSNGTLAAFASTNGALLDEVPPTVSASSDGVVQVAVGASDYMNFPMTTYTTTSQEIIAGVRAVASLWGGTGSGTGTLGFRGYDGVTETVFVAASTSFDPDSLTAISATYPLWYSAMWSGAASGAWTQTRLNDAALRGGFSTDATPDMGFSALYLEMATRPTPVVRQITTGEADEFTVDLRIDPYNSASVSYLLESTDATRGATFYYSVSGTPQTPVVVAPASTEEVVVNAASFGEISDVSLEPDPVP